MRYILSLYILGSFFLFGQNGITVGDIDFSYSQPKEYELGPIRVIGADNFDHQAIKLIESMARKILKTIIKGCLLKFIFLHYPQPHSTNPTEWVSRMVH